MSSPTTALVETGMTPVKRSGCSLMVKIIIGVTISAAVVAGAASAGYFLTVDTESNSVKETSPQNSSTSAPASGQTTTVTDQSASEQTTVQTSSDNTTKISNGQTTGTGLLGQPTGAELPGQTTGAGVPGQSTGAGVSGQTTGAGVPGQTTGAGVPGQTTGAGIPGQSTGAGVPGQTTGAGVSGQSTGAGVPGQSTGADVPGQTTGADVPGQTTGAGIPSQTPGASLPGQTTGAGLPGQTTGAGVPGQTTGDGIGQNTGQAISEQNTGFTELSPYVTNSQTSGQFGDTSIPNSDNTPFTPGENMGGTSPNIEVSTTFPLTTIPTTTAGPVCSTGYVRTVILSSYSGTSDKLWLRGANIPIEHLPSTDPDYNRFAEGDTKLDWNGRESGQDDEALGTPTLRLDTNNWRTDFCLDCSGTGNNRFQFKMYDTNWESVSGDDTSCFNGGNHYAACGKINYFYFGSRNCQINDFPDTSS